MESSNFLCYVLLGFIIVVMLKWSLRMFCLEERQIILENRRQILRRAQPRVAVEDRQGNIFTISDETSGNAGSTRYPDFFYLEPSGDEAARIRAQLEKDDKDLPSYDDVMRMTTPTTPPTTALASIPEIATNSISIGNLGPPPSPPDLTVPVPPYSEVDPNSATTSNNPAYAASTSRGASVTIPITNSASNTSV